MSRRIAPRENVASLRLPVPFFDLLMVLLVTCLVFVAPVRPENEMRAMDLPMAEGRGGGSASGFLAVVPQRGPQGWQFTVAGEQGAMAAAALAARAGGSRKIVVVVPPATPLQDFVDMQAALTAAHVPFALAVKQKETAP